MKHRQYLKHKKKVSEDCWSMDCAFYKWADEHLKTYLKDANSIVDLDYQKFTVDGTTLTQKEAIIHMIELVEKIQKMVDLELWGENIDYKEANKKYMETLEEFGKWWFKVLPAMWW